VKIYVTDEFEKLMHKAKLDDDVIVKVANELNNGLHDGELQSGSLYKNGSLHQAKASENQIEV
jgi:hypothetical protein